MGDNLENGPRFEGPFSLPPWSSAPNFWRTIRDDSLSIGIGRRQLCIVAALGTSSATGIAAGLGGAHWFIALVTAIIMGISTYILAVMTARGTSEAVRAARASQQTAQELSVDAVDFPGFERLTNVPRTFKEAGFSQEFLNDVRDRLSFLLDSPTSYGAQWADKVAALPEVPPSQEIRSETTESKTVLNASNTSKTTLWSSMLQELALNDMGRPYRAVVYGHDSRDFGFAMLTTLCPRSADWEPDFFFVTCPIPGENFFYPIAHVSLDSPDQWHWFITASPDGRPQDRHMLLLAYAVLDVMASRLAETEGLSGVFVEQCGVEAMSGS